MSDENLDRPIYGAEAIGREAHLLDDKGDVDVRKAYHALERGGRHRCRQVRALVGFYIVLHPARFRGQGRAPVMNAPKNNPAVELAIDDADPFADLSKLRLDQSFVELAGAKKLLTTVPVRRPHKQDFIRVHPGPEFRGAFAVEQLSDDRERYLVVPDIAAAVTTEIVMEMFYTAINRQRVGPRGECDCPVCTENLNPDIMVMKSAKNRV